jgi:hypothetical protein
MHSNFNFNVLKLQAKHGFCFTSNKNRARMRGTSPAIQFVSTEKPKIIAHSRAIFPNGKAKSAPVTSLEMEKLRNEPRPAHDERQ